MQNVVHIRQLATFNFYIRFQRIDQGCFCAFYLAGCYGIFPNIHKNKEVNIG